MKKCVASVLVVLAVMVLPLTVGASSVYLDRIPGYFGGTAGEFNVVPTGFGYSQYAAEATYGSGFESFCIEFNEYVAIPGTYNANFSGSATLGGIGGGSPDPVSVGTAWLYSGFALGTLDDYGYVYTPGAGREASAVALQQAIWYLENEITTDQSSNPFIQAIVTQFGSESLGRADSNGQFEVAALNLYARSGGNAQDMLYYGVAEPISLLLLGFGLVGSGLVARKLRRR